MFSVIYLYFIYVFSFPVFIKIRDAQQDGEPALWPAVGVLLPGLWHVSEAPEPTGGGHGEAHQSHRPPQTGEKR